MLEPRGDYKDHNDFWSGKNLCYNGTPVTVSMFVCSFVRLGKYVWVLWLSNAYGRNFVFREILLKSSQTKYAYANVPKRVGCLRFRSKYCLYKMCLSTPLNLNSELILTFRLETTKWQQCDVEINKVDKKKFGCVNCMSRSVSNFLSLFVLIFAHPSRYSTIKIMCFVLHLFRYKYKYRL